MLIAPLPTHGVADLGLLKRRMVIYAQAAPWLRSEIEQHDAEQRAIAIRGRPENLRAAWLCLDDDDAEVLKITKKQNESGASL